MSAPAPFSKPQRQGAVPLAELLDELQHELHVLAVVLGKALERREPITDEGWHRIAKANRCVIRTRDQLAGENRGR